MLYIEGIAKKFGSTQVLIGLLGIDEGDIRLDGLKLTTIYFDFFASSHLVM